MVRHVHARDGGHLVVLHLLRELVGQLDGLDARPEGAPERALDEAAELRLEVAQHAHAPRRVVLSRGYTRRTPGFARAPVIWRRRPPPARPRCCPPPPRGPGPGRRRRPARRRARRAPRSAPPRTGAGAQEVERRASGREPRAASATATAAQTSTGASAGVVSERLERVRGGRRDRALPVRARQRAVRRCRTGAPSPVSASPSSSHQSPAAARPARRAGVGRERRDAARRPGPGRSCRAAARGPAPTRGRPRAGAGTGRAPPRPRGPARCPGGPPPARRASAHRPITRSEPADARQHRRGARRRGRRRRAARRRVGAERRGCRRDEPARRRARRGSVAQA